MSKLINGNLINGDHEFEIVEAVPDKGYIMWNIGKNMIDGYLPLVQTGGYNGCQVDTTTMKAIKVKDAQVILLALGRGQKTIKSMETYIKRYSNSKNSCTRRHVERLKNALQIMYTIKGIENLED